MAKMDSFLNRLDDIMYEVWKLKNDTEHELWNAGKSNREIGRMFSHLKRRRVDFFQIRKGDEK